MDSDNITDDDEQDSISKQIVDYYKKYSQSRELPKYLSGNSLSYMPKIVAEDEKVQIPNETGPEALRMIDSSREEINDEEEKPVSPSSSTVSTRKLEWDNGADIGYVNCEKIHKSSSLPTVLTESKKNDEKTTQTQVHAVISHSSSSSEYLKEATGVQTSSSSISPSFPIEKPPISSSSSSNYASKLPAGSSSSSLATTLAYIKSKIGDPEAESTPKIVEKVIHQYCETPIVKTSRAKQGNKKRIFELCLTKPILIECVDNKKKGADKIIQTSFRECISEGIQTGESLLGSPALQRNNQSIIIIDNNEESEKVTQTDSSEAISLRSEGFEYVPGEQINQNQENLLAKATILSSSTEDSSIPLLAQLISQNQSKTLVGDVDKSISILQKLLKSKKYDDATKKRYIKKIVQKIIDSKYSEDSSTSSELFLPKRDARNQKLSENLPWVPPQLSKFTVKTVTDEFLPEKSEEKHKPKKKSIFTLSKSPESSLEKSSSCQSWKDDKTMSEKLLETQKHQGQGDQLVTFAKQERQHQLAWIKDEISHLTKLKGLLELGEKQIVPSQKTTTVYMLSQSKSPGKKKSGRNYVIETELAGGSSSDSISFNFQDNNNGSKNYHVRTGRSAHESGSKKLVGNIEVTSDENCTNIKVKTKRVEDEGEFAPKRPSLVGEGKYDTFPRSQRENQVDKCWPCGMTIRRNPEIERSWPSGMPKTRKPSQGSTKYVIDVPLSQIRTTLSNLNKISSQKLRRCSDAIQCELDCECKSNIKEIPQHCEATCLYQKQPKEQEYPQSRDFCSGSVQCEMGCTCRDGITYENKNISTLPLEKSSKRIQMDNQSKRRSSKTQYDPRFTNIGPSESVQVSVESKNQVIETVPKQTRSRNSQSSQDTNSVHIQYDPLEQNSQNSQVQCEMRNDSRDEVSETVHVETVHRLVQKDPQQARNIVTQYENYGCSESVQCVIPCNCKENIQNRDITTETQRRSYVNKNVQESDDFYDNSRRRFEQQLRDEDNERRRASRCSESVQCKIGCECKDVCSRQVQCLQGCECKSREYTAISDRIRERKIRSEEDEQNRGYSVRFHPDHQQLSFNDLSGEYSELRNVPSEREREENERRRHVCDKTGDCEFCDTGKCEGSSGKCALCKRFVQDFGRDDDFYESGANRNPEYPMRGREEPQILNKDKSRTKDKFRVNTNQNLNETEDGPNIPSQKTSIQTQDATKTKQQSLENFNDGQLSENHQNLPIQNTSNQTKTRQGSKDTINTDIPRKTSELSISEDRQKTSKKSSETSVHSKDLPNAQTLPENIETTQESAPKDEEDDVYIRSFVNIFGDKSSNEIPQIITIPETKEKQPTMSTIQEVSESYTESQPESGKKSGRNLRTSKKLQTDSVSESESDTSSNVTVPLQVNQRERDRSDGSVASSVIAESEAKRISKQISEKIQKSGSFDSASVDHRCRVGDEIDDLVGSRVGPSGRVSGSVKPSKTMSGNREDERSLNNMPKVDSLSSNRQQQQKVPLKEGYRKVNREDSSEGTSRNQREGSIRSQQKNRTGSQSGNVTNQRRSGNNEGPYDFDEEDRRDERDRPKGRNYSKENTNRRPDDRNTQREESRRQYDNEPDGINANPSQRGYDRNQRGNAGNYQEDSDEEERAKSESRKSGDRKRGEQPRGKNTNDSDDLSMPQSGYHRNQRKNAGSYDDFDDQGRKDQRARPEPRNYSKDSTNRSSADRRGYQQKTRLGSEDDILRDETSGNYAPSNGPYREQQRRSYFIEPDDNSTRNRTGGPSRRTYEESQRITNRQSTCPFNAEQNQNKCIVCCDCKKDRKISSGDSISEKNQNVQSGGQPIGHSFSDQAYDDPAQQPINSWKHRASQDSKKNYLNNDEEGSVPLRRNNTCICTAENLPVYQIPPCICRPASQKFPNCICYSQDDSNFDRTSRQRTQDGKNARRDYGSKNLGGSNEGRTRERSENLQDGNSGRRDYGPQNVDRDNNKFREGSSGRNGRFEEVGGGKDSSSDLSSQRSDDRVGKDDNQASSSKNKNRSNFSEERDISRTKKDQPRSQKDRKSSYKDSAGRNNSSEEVGRSKDSNSDSSSQRSDNRAENQASSSKNKNRNFREDPENPVQSKNENERKKSQKDIPEETPEESGRRRDSNLSSGEKPDSNYFPQKNSEGEKPSESSEDKDKNDQAIEEKTDQISTLSSSSSGSSSESSSDSDSLSSCMCCKRNMKLPSKTLFQLKDTINNQVIPLCRPCYRSYQATPQNVYSNPTHICGCYSLINKQTLAEIKKTIDDLNELNNDCYCSCAGVKNLKSSTYCKHCKCKLKKATKSQNGIAYMLTFEETKPGEKLDEDEEEAEKKKPLEEIKVKIPVTTVKKKHKDKANKKKKKKKKREEEQEQEEQTRVVTLYSLQEYLCKNRPQFVEIAECRRKSMMDSRCEREESSEMKKMRFLLNYSSQPAEKKEKYAKPRVFSAKEVREINKKNYKKLPEVQKKLVDNKEKQIRQANRLIADTFNRKLRDNVLKGKLTISADVNVVNL